MDSIKIELLSLIIIYIGLGILAWFFMTRHWLFFVFLAVNIILVYIIIASKCHDIDFIKNWGEKILAFLMKKYGGDWFRDVQNVKQLLKKYNITLNKPSK